MKPELKDFEFTEEKITEACDNWAVFPQFVGETCSSCKKTANVLLGPGWICVCGAFNAQALYHGPMPHANPDMGPTATTIKNGVSKSKKWKSFFDGSVKSGEPT